jgi:hypothetical protein
MRSPQSLDGRRGAGFQLILKDDQPEETQIRLGLFAEEDVSLNSSIMKKR